MEKWEPQTGTEPPPGGLPADLSQPAVRGLPVTCPPSQARWFVHLANGDQYMDGVRKGGGVRCEGQGASHVRRV